MKSSTQQNSYADLLDTYVSAYKSIEAKSCFTLKEQDVVLLSMFFEKGCLHCMDAHRVISARMSAQNEDDGSTEIPEVKLKTLSAFSRSVASRKGYSKTNIEDFFNSDYSEKQLLCVIAIHGILTWNNFFSRIYEGPLAELTKNSVQSKEDIRTLEIITLA